MASKAAVSNPYGCADQYSPMTAGTAVDVVVVGDVRFLQHGAEGRAEVLGTGSAPRLCHGTPLDYQVSYRLGRGACPMKALESRQWLATTL